MANAINVSDQAAKLAPGGYNPAFTMLVMLANAGLVIGLLQILPWLQCALLVIAGCGLAGGVVYMAPVLDQDE